MKPKPSVRVKGAQPEIIYAMMIVESVFRGQDLEPVLTSCNDSKHSANSKHYEGRAIDLRLASRCLAEKLGWDWPQTVTEFDRSVMYVLRNALPEFDVILENHQASPYSWHYHIEFDPKE